MANWASTVNPQDLKDNISRAVYNGERPDAILDVVWDPTRNAKAARHEWGEKYLRSTTTTLQTTVNNSITTIVLPTGYGTKFNTFNQFNVAQGTVDCILRIDQEEMIVTAGAGTDSLTVTRGANGTAAAAHTAGATIMAFHIWPEGSDYGADFYQGAGTQYNMTQIFRKDLNLSGSMQAFKGLDGDNTMAKQLTEKDMQIMREMAQAVYLGNRVGTTNDPKRRMGGIYYYSAKDSSAYTLGKTMIENNIILPLLEGGASANDLVLAVPNSLYNRITALKQNLVVSGGMRNGERGIIADVDTYRFGDALVTFFRSTCVPNGNVCAFDKSRVHLIPAPGRLDVEEPLGKVGDNDKVMKLSEVTMECENLDTCGLWFTNVS